MGRRQAGDSDELRRRIVAFHRVRGRDLRPHPENPRRHPQAQRDAMAAVLAKIGQAGVLMAYRDPEAPDRLTLFDGHLRTADFAAAEWDVAETDLSPDEAREMLLSFDPLSAMAEYHREALDALSARAEVAHEALAERVEAIRAEAAGSVPVVDHAPTTESDQCGQGSNFGAMRESDRTRLVFGDIECPLDERIYARLDELCRRQFGLGVAYAETVGAVLEAGCDACE